LRDGVAALRKKKTDSGRQKRRKDAVYVEVEEGCIEHVMIHTKIKIGVGAVLDERGKEEVLKWMRKVKKERYIGRG